MRKTRIVVAVIAICALTACTQAEAGKRTAVASIYPLAFAAERILGPEWEVIDLTPPGTEAHDVEVSLEDRAAIQDADLVLYLGDIGFQPQVEEAVQEARGVVVTASGPLSEVDGTLDPHFWLTAAGIRHVLLDMCPAVDRIDRDIDCPGSLWDEASRMHSAYHREIERGDCRFQTLIVTHEAFGALEVYDLDQIGLSGLEPEAEPSAARLAEAARLVERGQAGAVFYDEHEGARQAAEAFAADVGVPALPLSTLESRPKSGDYFTVMDDNLESLREGLQCQ